VAEAGLITGGPSGGALRPARRWPPVALLLPSLAAALATLSPVVYLLLRLSEAGSDAFDLLVNERTFRTLVRTATLAGAVTACATLISLPLAWLTVRTDLPLRRVWALLTVLPLVVPSYVGAFTVVEALGPKGLLQQVLQPFGVDRLPEIYGFHGAVFTLTALTYPYVLLSVRTALWGMDPALEESSRSLGHGRWATFVRVTLPQLRPALAAGGLLVALYALADFGAVSILRFNSFTYVIYSQYQSAFDRTLAAASSLVLIALALALLGIEAATRGRSRYYRAGRGASRRAAAAPLGVWRWPAFAFCAFVTALGLFLPLAVLGYLVAQGLDAGQEVRPVWEAARNSVYVSALAAACAVVVAIPVALLSVRYPSKLSALLERAAYLGFALPGIVVALALVFLGIRYVPSLYQTLALLVFAYVLLFLPIALGSVRTALMQINPHLEEAGRSLGASPLRAFLTITLPLLRPGLATGAAMIFLVTMKELPATLILGPIGFDTLATETWSAASAALQARAALSALVLVFASAVPMALLIYWERREEW